MTFEEFENAILSGSSPTEMNGPLKALARAASGDWDGAHALVQDDKSREAAWVHAHLHRKEGDEGNSRYWYRRAGRQFSEESFEDEWKAIVEELLSR